jgi:predicted kinase
MSKILVLQGPPASSKTTFAREFIKDHHNYVIVSRDSIRDSLGEYWVPSRENLVSKIERDNIITAIDMGYNVIIDATNLNPKTIAKWEALADEKKCEIEYKEFWIPFHEAIQRDKNPDRLHPVGFKVIKDFYSKYNPDLLKEDGWDNRYIKDQDSLKDKAIICDVDGTIALHQGRSPYDYENCTTDKPNTPLIKILEDLFCQGNKIIFVSGRENVGNCYQKTSDWLTKYFEFPFELIMRKENDHRPDELIKEEIYHKEIEPKYYIKCVFDDRDKVVKMWREQGLLCNQVYYGDF